jgi:hypothetical protein
MAERSKARGTSAGGSRSAPGRGTSPGGDRRQVGRRPGREETAAEREYRGYEAGGPGGAGDEPDVLLDVPVLKVDSIHLEVDDLQAHVALKANVLDLVNLNVGVDVRLGTVRLDIKGVEAQALVKARLDHVAAIVDRVLTTIDRNPELVESIARTAEEVGAGAGRALEGIGGAVEEVGEGSGQALGEVGEGAGQAVGELGQGAGQVVGDVGQAAGGLGQAAGARGEAPGGLSGGDVAKAAAKTVAKEIGSAASDEAKEIGVAATRKVKELGERRRHRRADRHHATEAALRVADELGVELDDLDGSGAGGRITVRDVRGAAKA